MEISTNHFGVTNRVDKWDLLLSYPLGQQRHWHMQPRQLEWK